LASPSSAWNRIICRPQKNRFFLRPSPDGIVLQSDDGKQRAHATGGHNTVPTQPVPADTGDSKPAVPAMASSTGASARTVDSAVKQAIDSLLSSPLTHEQRRDMLKKLVESAK